MSKQTKIQARKGANALAANASQTEPSSPQASGSPPPDIDVTALIHKVTQTFSDVMEEKLNKFSNMLEKISSTVESQSKRITAAEQRVSDVEDIVTDLETRLASAEKKIKQMADGIDDLENRGRRDNICILNLEEGTEGREPILFFESWLPTVLGLSTSAERSRIKIDRVYRGLGPRGARPRPVIIKLHNPRDKLRIMAAARKKPDLEHDGKQIFIHQDLSPVIRGKRRAFNDVCQALINKGIRFGMRFPATLIVNFNGKEHRFETRGEAEDFLKTLG